MSTKKQLIYLDHASATPLDPKVFLAIKPYLLEEFGNASSLHAHGVKSRNALEKARRSVAEVLNARPEEIVFTAGATESINLAILGLRVEVREKRKKSKIHYITTAIEHEAVLACMREVKRRGGEVTILPVDGEGFVDPKILARAIKPSTRFISVHYANNEIGTVQNLPGIARVIREANKSRAEADKIFFHSDASQTPEYLNVNVNKLGVDLLTLNGGKIYGPKQSGILYVRKGTPLQPVIFGGGQEKGLRGGTESVASAVGFARALEVATEHVSRNTYLKTEVLRDKLWVGVKKIYPKAVLNGPILRQGYGGPAAKFIQTNRLSNNLNVSFMGLDGEALMFYLDGKGISVSTGSACSSKSGPSHVILGISKNNAGRASSSIRFTLGRGTTRNEIDRVLKILPGVISLVKTGQNA